LKANCGTARGRADGQVTNSRVEKMGFAVRKSDRALLQELDAQLTATAATRDGVLSKSIPGWSN